MTQRQVTMERADEIIVAAGLVDMVEDYEFNEFGHVYTLSDGTTAVVDGESVRINEEA